MSALASSLKALQSGPEVHVVHTDWAGRKSVVILTPAEAQALIEDLIEAEAMATSHVELRTRPAGQVAA